MKVNFDRIVVYSDPEFMTNYQRCSKQLINVTFLYGLQLLLKKPQTHSKRIEICFHHIPVIRCLRNYFKLKLTVTNSFKPLTAETSSAE